MIWREVEGELLLFPLNAGELEGFYIGEDQLLTKWLLGAYSRK